MEAARRLAREALAVIREVIPIVEELVEAGVVPREYLEAIIREAAVIARAAGGGAAW